MPLRYRSGSHKDEKRRIAALAAARVDDGVATVGMTGGTTTTEVARRLVDRSGLTVVTNALNIASELALRPTVKLIVTGGTARSESYELVGPLAESTLAGLNLDVAVVGVDGVSVAGGLTTYHEVEAATNRALIARAGRGDRRGRRLQGPQAGAGAHLRHRCGRRADHRRQRRRDRARAPRGGRRDGDLGLTATAPGGAHPRSTVRRTLSGALYDDRKRGSPMTTDHTDVPSPRRRALALLSLLATAVLVVEVIVFVARNAGWLVVALVGLAVAVAGVWWILTEHLPRRAIGFRDWWPAQP